MSCNTCHKTNTYQGNTSYQGKINYQANANYQGTNYQGNQNILCTECLETHDQNFEHNYVWLDALGHGPVELVWFVEPAHSNDYVLYTTKW